MKKTPPGVYQLTLKQDALLDAPILLCFNADEEVTVLLSKGSRIFVLAPVPVALQGGSPLHCLFSCLEKPRWDLVCQ